MRSLGVDQPRRLHRKNDVVTVEERNAMILLRTSRGALRPQAEAAKLLGYPGETNVSRLGPRVISGTVRPPWQDFINQRLAEIRRKVIAAAKERQRQERRERQRERRPAPRRRRVVRVSEEPRSERTEEPQLPTEALSDFETEQAEKIRGRLTELADICLPYLSEMKRLVNAHIAITGEDPSVVYGALAEKIEKLDEREAEPAPPPGEEKVDEREEETGSPGPPPQTEPEPEPDVPPAARGDNVKVLREYAKAVAPEPIYNAEIEEQLKLTPHQRAQAVQALFEEGALKQTQDRPRQYRWVPEEDRVGKAPADASRGAGGREKRKARLREELNARVRDARDWLVKWHGDGEWFKPAELKDALGFNPGQHKQVMEELIRQDFLIRNEVKSGPALRVKYNNNRNPSDGSASRAGRNGGDPDGVGAEAPADRGRTVPGTGVSARGVGITPR